MTRLTDILKILLLLSYIIFSGCSKDLHTGTYTVERVNGRFVEFKGVNNYYYIPSDTIKVGDKLKLKRVYKQNKATIY